MVTILLRRCQEGASDHLVVFLSSASSFLSGGVGHPTLLTHLLIINSPLIEGRPFILGVIVIYVLTSPLLLTPPPRHPNY